MPFLRRSNALNVDLYRSRARVGTRGVSANPVEARNMGG